MVSAPPDSPSPPESATPPVKLDYAAPNTPARVPAWLAFLVPLVLLLIVATALLPSLRPPTDRGQNRTQCLANLRHIGTAIAMYASEHNGICPPNLGSVSIYVPQPRAFVCPSSPQQPTTASSPDAIGAAVNTVPTCCSYVYYGAGRTHAQLPPDFILAHELAMNHKDGMNFLLPNGVVERCALSKSKKILSELQSGYNPPRPQNIK